MGRWERLKAKTEKAYSYHLQASLGIGEYSFFASLFDKNARIVRKAKKKMLREKAEQLEEVSYAIYRASATIFYINTYNNTDEYTWMNGVYYGIDVIKQKKESLKLLKDATRFEFEFTPLTDVLRELESLQIRKN